MGRQLFRVMCLMMLLSIHTKLVAYETDQYSTLFYPIADSTEVMDKIVNDGIEHVVNNWNKERSDFSLLSRIAGFFHSRQFEKWVNESTLIDSRNVKSDSVFKTTGWKNSIIIQWKGLASSFTLNKVQIGSDKLSHFFGVGWIYWKMSEIEHAAKSEMEKRKAVVERGVFTEETYWGRSSTNVFSNADLVTNWEGYLFYRGVLEDNIVTGKKAIIRWEGDRPVIQRKFSFRDHVNDFWSEALLPNDYDPSLAASIINVLKTYCEREEYIKNPGKWVSRNHQYYWKKYLFVGLKRNAIKFRMDTVCADYNAKSVEEKNKFRVSQKKIEQTFKEDASGGDFRLLDLISKASKSISRIDSVVPTCNVDIDKAKNEHKMIEAMHKNNGDKIRQKLIKATKKVLKSKNANPINVFYAELFGKVKHKKIRRRKFDGLQLNRLTGNILINKKKVKIIAEYSSYGDDNKACIILPIPFNKSPHPVRYGYVKASNYYCNYINKKTGAIKTKIFWRAYDSDKKLRSSLDSYYAMLDQEAYIYRMIPKLCKWY